MKIHSVKKHNITLLPIVGIGLFVFFYIMAALSYPGGADISPDQIGFSFWNNYLCDLLNDHAINGAVNISRPFAITGMIILCASLILIWYNVPKLFPSNSTNVRVMKVSGIISLAITFLLPLGEHDFLVRFAGFIAIPALIISFIELFKVGYYRISTLGFFCFIIFLLNYYIYETGSYINSLPVIQKITFVCFISWFIFLDVLIYRKSKTRIDQRTVVPNIN